jgi:hypothetical protein
MRPELHEEPQGLLAGDAASPPHGETASPEEIRLLTPGLQLATTEG